MEKYNQKFNFVFVAHKSVQVKPLISLFCKKDLNEEIKDVESITYKRDEKQTYKIFLNYTPGFQSFDDMPLAFYRNAHALIAICDPCNLESVNGMRDLLNSLKEKCSQTCLIYVVLY